MKKFHLLIVALLTSTFIYGQVCPTNYGNQWEWGSHSNWFFGDGVFLNFPNGGGAPTATYKSANPVDACTACTNKGYEGTAAISDNAGKLLAYSNGRSLWLDNGTLVANNMLAGNEAGATGLRSSAVQGIVSVRHPLNPDEVFIFTSDDALTPTDIGLNYTVFNIKTKTASAPIRLQTDVGANYRTTEQIDATFHSNGVDVWVVVRQSGANGTSNFRNFYSYLITCTGLNTVPVKSNQAAPEYGHRFNFGAAALTVDPWGNDNDRGALKISWDGTKAATANDLNGWNDNDETVVIYRFDNSTGLLSDAKACSAIEGQWSWDASNPTIGNQYDCEWAPDSKGLYVSSGAGTAAIRWMDASLATGPLIYQSTKTITTNASAWCDIKLGADGVLYQSTRLTPFLSTYTFPSTADLNSGTNGTYGTMPLSQNANRGLSNMFHPPIDQLQIVNPGQVCHTDAPIDLAANYACSGVNAELLTHTWTSARGAITNATTGTYDPTIAGVSTDTVIFTLTNTCGLDDTLIFNVINCLCPLGDTALVATAAAMCLTASSLDLNTLLITAKAGSWSLTGVPAGSSSTPLSGTTFNPAGVDPGVYTVRYTINNPADPTCPDGAERNITVNQCCIPVEVSAPANVCAGATSDLSTLVTAGTGTWAITGGPGSASIDANSGVFTSSGTVTGTYQVTFTTNMPGCTDNKIVNVTVSASVVSLGNDETICANSADLQVTASVTDPAAAWTSTPSGFVNATGLVNISGAAAAGSSVTITYGGGCLVPVSKTINFTNSTTDIGVATLSACSYDPDIQLTATATDAGAVWSSTPTGFVSASGLVNVAGAYASIGDGGTVTISYGGGTGCLTVDNVVITINDCCTPLTMTKPTSICTGDTTNLGLFVTSGTGTWFITSGPGGASLLLNTGKFTSSNTVTGKYVVTFNSNQPGCSSTNAIDTVTVLGYPKATISPDTVLICSGSSVTLSASSTIGTDLKYKWNNDSISSTLMASDAGEYWVVVYNGSCPDTARITAASTPSPKVTLPIDTTICALRSRSYEAFLTHNVKGTRTIQWSSIGFENDSSVIIEETPSTISVTVTDADGCSGTDTIVVTEYCIPPTDDIPNLYIPGGCPTCPPTFTPFGTILPVDVSESHFEVYDRWGLLMFRTTENIPSWDGTNGGDGGRACPSGVYFWIWNYTEVTGESHKKNGFVEVLQKK